MYARGGRGGCGDVEWGFFGGSLGCVCCAADTDEN
jgi:hypothetical protein